MRLHLPYLDAYHVVTLGQLRDDATYQVEPGFSSSPRLPPGRGHRLAAPKRQGAR